MGGTLDALLALQQIELKLVALRSRIAAKQRSVQSHEKKAEQLDRQIRERHENIRRKQADMAQVELEIKIRDQTLAKLRQALNTSKTNKEYAAILAQINLDKADTAKLEDRVLAMMAELEDLRREEAVLREQQRGEQARVDSLRADAEAFQRDCQKQLDLLESSRTTAAALVPNDALDVFERVAAHHDGEALAMVLQPHPKRQEFICDGCNMSVTLEQFASLQAQDKVQLCHNCGRMLVLDPHMSAAG